VLIKLKNKKENAQYVVQKFQKFLKYINN